MGHNGDSSSRLHAVQATGLLLHYRSNKGISQVRKKSQANPFAFGTAESRVSPAGQSLYQMLQLTTQPSRVSVPIVAGS